MKLSIISELSGIISSQVKSSLYTKKLLRACLKYVENTVGTKVFIEMPAHLSEYENTQFVTISKRIDRLKKLGVIQTIQKDRRYFFDEPPIISYRVISPSPNPNASNPITKILP